MQTEPAAYSQDLAGFPSKEIAPPRSRVIRISNFPGSWQDTEQAVLALPANVTDILSRFGDLMQEPVVSTADDGSVIVTAQFADEYAAEGAARRLEGADNRVLAELLGDEYAPPEEAEQLFVELLPDDSADLEAPPQQQLPPQASKLVPPKAVGMPEPKDAGKGVKGSGSKAPSKGGVPSKSNMEAKASQSGKLGKGASSTLEDKIKGGVPTKAGSKGAMDGKGKGSLENKLSMGGKASLEAKAGQPSKGSVDSKSGKGMSGKGGTDGKAGVDAKGNSKGLSDLSSKGSKGGCKGGKDAKGGKAVKGAAPASEPSGRVVRIAAPPPEWTHQDVEEMCSQHGAVDSVMPTESGGYEVTYAAPVDAESAVLAINALKVEGKPGPFFFVCELLEGDGGSSGVEDPDVFRSSVGGYAQVHGDISGKGVPIMIYADELQLLSGEPGSSDREVFLRSLPIDDYTQEQLNEWLDVFGNVEDAIF